MEQIKIKNAILVATIILLIGFYLAQYKVEKTNASKKFDNNTMYGRLRVNKTSSLVLTTTPQKLIWNGTSALGLNINTFLPDPMGSGNQLVTWNGTSNIFNFYNTSDINYFVLLTCNVTSTLLTTPVDLRIRFTVPNGVSSGVDLHFPDPDVAGYADLGPCSYISATAYNIVIPIYISQQIRTNGLYVEAYISNTSLGTITLTSATLLIQSGAPTN